jgi:hypothetical protein
MLQVKCINLGFYIIKIMQIYKNKISYFEILTQK